MGLREGGEEVDGADDDVGIREGVVEGVLDGADDDVGIREGGADDDVGLDEMEG